LLRLLLLLAVDVVRPDHRRRADGHGLLRPYVGRHGLDDAAAWKSDLRNYDRDAPVCPDLNRYGGAYRQRHSHAGVGHDDAGLRCGDLKRVGKELQKKKRLWNYPKHILKETEGGK